jgi:hypothetical protein
MFSRLFKVGILLVLATWLSVQNTSAQQARTWTDSFLEDSSALSTRGANPYFTLQPGYRVTLRGTENAKTVELQITVLTETKYVGLIDTRVVEERTFVDSELVKVSRKFFAISRRTNGVYYFGADVDVLTANEITGHVGSWQSGQNGARYGLLIAGSPLLGSRYCQELAPGVAMDRSEVISLTEQITTGAGIFENCLKTEKTTSLVPGTRKSKCYAEGIGLVQDGELLFASRSFVAK